MDETGHPHFSEEASVTPRRETGRRENAIDRRLDQVLQGGWEARLQTESYEDAVAALEEMNALRDWRTASRTSSFRDFYRLFESVGTLARAPLAPDERATLRQELIDRLTGQAQHASPRVNDLYLGLLAELEGTPFTPRFEQTATKLNQLRESGDLRTLLSPTTPYQFKLDRMQKRLEGYLKGSKFLDRRDRQLKEGEALERAQAQAEQPTTPPPASDESKPGMDEMERSKEGEQPPAIWTISPAYGGYYKEQSFDTWDRERNVWRASAYAYEPVTILSVDATTVPDVLRLQAQLRANQWTRLPITYKHDFLDIEGYNQTLKACHVQRDQNGDYLIAVKSDRASVVELTIVLKPEERSLEQQKAPELLVMDANLSEETQQKLQEINRRKQGNVAKARATASYVMRRLKYSNDSSFNQVYDTHPNGYIAAIDEHLQADCDVANTYFAALCTTLRIPVRHAVGHMVKGKDNEGNARITSGTGHAWSEVWDEVTSQWVRIDATPPGDPQLEQEEQQGQSVPGDYGEQEAIGPTDEQLAKLQQKLAELTNELSYTQEERELAEATGVELAEARQIVKEIQVAEDTRLPNGERVVDVLSQLFSLIIEARKTVAPDYSGPLRKREGGEEIDDIVTHKIGIRSGVTDPASRRKPDELPQIEQIFGGFDVHMIGDKSGSMSETVDGETKWALQRRAEYLILSSLYRFEQNLKRAQVRMTDPLSVRTHGISFRGSGEDELDEDKPLSDEFAPADKVRLWRSLGNQGWGNGDVPALEYVHNQISKERQAVEEKGQKDDRLRLVVACSDGYPDDVTRVHQLAEALGILNAVVVGIGLTETSASVPHIFDTPHSRGDIARDINDLPAIVAKHLVHEAIKLFPERSKASVSRMIETIVAKFALV